MELTSDPRPLVGEPLSVDLLNTVWRDAAGEHDLLAAGAGVELWLAANHLAATPAVEETRLALHRARDALRRHLTDLLRTGEASVAAVDDLNEVLAHGGLRRRLDRGTPVTEAFADDPSRLPAWRAVEDYLRLLEQGTARLRSCADEECVLHFYDVSKRGDRRWCSMAGCGNRAKARRHYERSRPS